MIIELLLGFALNGGGVVCARTKETPIAEPAVAVVASCVADGEAVTYAITVRTQPGGKFHGRLDEFMLGFHGRVVSVVTPPGWASSQALSPQTGATRVTWQAQSNAAAVKKGNAVGGFIVRVEGASSRISCDRSYRFDHGLGGFGMGSCLQ